MSILKGLIDSLSAVFADVANESQQTSASSGADRASGGGESRTVSSFMNEKIAFKLKGYFDLAKEEIDKAVKAEEWGLIDDAILHYKRAHKILVEAGSTPVPSHINSSESQKVKAYSEKISKWQDQVTDRLKVLSKRSGLSPTAAITSSSSSSKANKKAVQGTTIPRRNAPAVGKRSADIVNAKISQQSGSQYDDKLIEMINAVILDKSPSVKWDDVAGLENAKQALMEMVILPTKRKDLFTGLRRPPRGLLLFGPPGNGKTMLAKAVASESDATFFNVSASSLTSKWVGEGEKLVRTLFMVAISKQPSVIFIDEIDSIMSTRTTNENEASRRLKSEFLVQFDGVTSSSDDLVIVIGATNKPQELDDAVLRRLVKRIYIPLPDESVRRVLFKTKLKGQAFSIPGGELERLVKETEGYSGSDLQALCEEAAMMPIRELGANVLTVKANQVRSLRYNDFVKAMKIVRPSLQKNKWEELQRWNKEFGAN
ncbi:unnamed protein product [Rhodiola kirilowii]